MKIEKSEIKGYHFFYIAFFVSYFFLLYFLLYHPNGLSPFQINIHFFSNVIGSLSKRFLVETAPYALLFYLIYHSKVRLLRILNIALFLIILATNLASMFYYFVARTSIQYYVVKAFQLNLFFSYLKGAKSIMFLVTVIAIILISYFLYRLRAPKSVPRHNYVLFSLLFAILTFGGSLIPVIYSRHMSVLANDILEKKLDRLTDLESSGISKAISELRFEFFTPSFQVDELTEEEQQSINALGLNSKKTTSSDFHPKKIILIASESLSQSFISHYNPELDETTPFIDSLIEEYPHLDDFYPSATYTLHGLASSLCSHMNTKLLETNDSFECLPNLLKKAGYNNEFIRGFSKYYLQENLFFDKIGFETITAMEEFDDEHPDFKDERPELYDTWGFTDDYLFDEAIQRLKEKNDEKLFMTILTVDTHALGGRCYLPRTAEDYKNDVLFSVNCFDRLLESFFDKLTSENLLDDDLLIVLTSDHLYPAYSWVPGDGGDNGFTAKPGKIPLIFVSKHPVELMAKQASQLDITPTLLDLLDIDAPNYYIGKSMLSNNNIIPMGRNGFLAYMLPKQVFLGFNLLLREPQRPQTREYYVDYMFGPSKDIESLTSWVNERRRNNEQDFVSDSTLLKWLRNSWLKNPSSSLIVNWRD